MAALTTLNGGRAGVDIAGVAAASGGDTFTNTGKEILIVKNGDSSSHNVTITTSVTVDGNAVADPVVAVGAGVTKSIGPFPRWIFGSTVSVAYSSVTSTTVAVLSVVAEPA